MCYFSPRKQAWTSRYFFHLTASHGISCVDKSIIALTLKRKTIWMKPSAFFTQLCGTIPMMIVRQSCVMKCLGFNHVVFLFKVRRNYAFVNTMRRRQMKTFPLLQACSRGEKYYILKMTLPQKNSPRMKTPYPYLMNLVSNYLEKNILSSTVKINGIQSRMSLKLRIKVVAFFLGHPVYKDGWLIGRSGLESDQFMHFYLLIQIQSVLTTYLHWFLFLKFFFYFAIESPQIPPLI